jgi:general stress protein 26
VAGAQGVNMPATTRDQRDARAELFARLSDVRAGMLGVGKSQSRMRPMTHFLDDEKAVLHFLTSRKTDLAAEVGQGSVSHYCLADDADGYYAWITGTLTPNEDAARLDKIWNPVAGAWFSGRDDPDILLLSMPIREAEVWSSTDSTLQFGIEIARANLDPDKEPDLGAHDIIQF